LQSRSRSELAGEDDLLDAEGRVGERALALFHEAQAPALPHLSPPALAAEVVLARLPELPGDIERLRGMRSRSSARLNELLGVR